MAEIGINTVMQVFKDNLAMTIKNSQLPIGIIYYVFKDVYNDNNKNNPKSSVWKYILGEIHEKNFNIRHFFAIAAFCKYRVGEKVHLQENSYPWNTSGTAKNFLSGERIFDF